MTEYHTVRKFLNKLKYLKFFLYYQNSASIKFKINMFKQKRFIKLFDKVHSL